MSAQYAHISHNKSERSIRLLRSNRYVARKLVLENESWWQRVLLTSLVHQSFSVYARTRELARFLHLSKYHGPTCSWNMVAFMCLVFGSRSHLPWLGSHKFRHPTTTHIVVVSKSHRIEADCSIRRYTLSCAHMRPFLVMSPL